MVRRSAQLTSPPRCIDAVFTPLRCQVRPEHLLWALLKLKNYSTDDICASLRWTSRPTFQKSVWMMKERCSFLRLVRSVRLARGRWRRHKMHDLGLSVFSALRSLFHFTILTQTCVYFWSEISGIVSNFTESDLHEDYQRYKEMKFGVKPLRTAPYGDGIMTILIPRK